MRQNIKEVLDDRSAVEAWMILRLTRMKIEAVYGKPMPGSPEHFKARDDD